MKKLLTFLLTLVMAICLINVNTNTIEAVEAKAKKGTLYFGYNGTKWSLWKTYNSEGATPAEQFKDEYNDPKNNKWEASANTLTLKKGFKYDVEEGESVIDFSKITANTTLVIDGTVDINTQNCQQGILIPKEYIFTIKGKTGTQIDKLTVNVKANTGRAILSKGRNEAETATTPGIVKIENCTIHVDSNSVYEIARVYGFEAKGAKIEFNNKGTGAAIDCIFKDAAAVNNFADSSSSLDLKSGEVALRVTVDASIESTVRDTFNNKYTFEIKDSLGAMCRGYFVKTSASDLIYELNEDKDIVGKITSTTSARLVTVTATNVAAATFSGGKWSLMVNGSELPDRRTAANPNGKWDISGDNKEVTLTLYDGFELGSTSVETISFTPTNEKDLDVIIKVEGQADIVSSYEGDQKHAVIKANKSQDGTKKVLNLEIVGNGNSELTILAGSSSYENGSDVTDSATTVIDAPDTNVTIKNIKTNLSAPDHKNKKRVTGVKAKKLTLNNGKATIKAAQKETVLNPGPPPSLNANLGTALDVEKIEVLNNSKLELTAAAAASFAKKGTAFELKGDKMTITGSYDTKGKQPAKKVKHGTVDLTQVSSLPEFDTFCASSEDLGGVDVPLQRVVIENVQDPSPSPSKKDESCEKVIGPTWHWNNDKGICEDVGIVGTSTR